MAFLKGIMRIIRFWIASINHHGEMVNRYPIAPIEGLVYLDLAKLTISDPGHKKGPRVSNA